MPAPNNKDSEPKILDPVAQDQEKLDSKLGEIAVDGSSQPEDEEITSGISRRQRFRRWYKTHRKISIPLTILVFLLIVASIPWSRYQIAAVFVKRDVSIRVLDSKTLAPVSEAEVALSNGQKSKTNGTGYAYFPGVKPGKLDAQVTKTYYKNLNIHTTVGVVKSSKTLTLDMQATGRQVKISVSNLITKRGLADVDIRMGKVDVKTDKSGNATAVLPVGTTTQKAKLKLNDYNEAEVTVKVSDQEVKQNNFSLTPSGQIYFLSNRSGRVDVMKSNLDGTDPKVVLAGTGSEDPNNTVMIASPDWEYLALLARRDPNGAKLYIISTNDDQLSTADEGSAVFTLAGWRGNNLIYTVARNDLSPWKTGASKLKSYDASTGKLILLDQTSGVGDATSNAYEYYGLVHLSANSVIYAKGWTGQNTSPADLSGRQISLSSISPTGQDRKVIANYDAVTKYISFVPHGLNSVYIVQSDQGQTTNYTYSDYTVGSGLKAVSLNTDQLYRQYPSYFISPGTKQTLWSEKRDTNVILVGDGNGLNGKVLPKTGDFQPLGWFTNQYLILSKNSSELYLMNASGGDPVKAGDYLSETYYEIMSGEVYR
jgi:hypothetical protein